MNLRALDRWGWIFLILGIGLVANALWMLAGPMHWYRELPAAVPDTGPFNPHFVRDIGCAFLAVGVALIWGAFREHYRYPLAIVSAIFLVAHAALHMYDTLRGYLDHTHWALDLPGVYLPAILLVLACIAVKPQSKAELSEEPDPRLP
jgi:hypothetical protein